MKYDFTSIIDRHNMDAIAVDGLGTGEMSPAKPKEGFDIIPMWVADMNFPTVPTIPEAIIERAKHPQSTVVVNDISHQEKNISSPSLTGRQNEME